MQSSIVNMQNQLKKKRLQWLKVWRILNVKFEIWEMTRSNNNNKPSAIELQAERSHQNSIGSRKSQFLLRTSIRFIGTSTCTARETTRSQRSIGTDWSLSERTNLCSRFAKWKSASIGSEVAPIMCWCPFLQPFLNTGLVTSLIASFFSSHLSSYFSIIDFFQCCCFFVFVACFFFVSCFCPSAPFASDRVSPNSFQLPKETLMFVFGFCSESDLGHFALVNRSWSSAVRGAWLRRESLKLTGQMARTGMVRIVEQLRSSSLKKLEMGEMASEEMLTLTPILSRFVLWHSWSVLIMKATILFVLALSRMQNLESLIVTHCDSLDDSGFAALASILYCFPRLKVLQLFSNSSSTAVADQGLEILSRKLHTCPLLHTVNIGYIYLTPAAQHAFFSSIPSLTSLRFLDVSAIHLASGFASFLAVLPDLAPVLEGLNLSVNELDETHWASLAPLLPRLTRLQALTLRNMSITSEHFLLLAPALAQIPSLTSLNLADNPLGVGQGLSSLAPHIGATAMANMLTSLTSSQELNFRDCQFDSTDLLIILQSFYYLPLLRSLILSGLFLDHRVVEPLISALLYLNDLRFLNIISFHSQCHFREASRSRLRAALMSKFPHLVIRS